MAQKKSTGGRPRRQPNREPEDSERRTPTGSKKKGKKLYLGRFNEFQAFALLYLLIICVLNIVCWMSSGFCDFYVRYCHPVFLNTYGRITSLFPFSVGEVLIEIGLVLCVIAAFAWIPMFRNRKRKKKTNAFYLSRFYYRVFIAILLNVMMIMTLNCVSMYHRAALDPNPEVEAKEKYTGEDLMAVRNYLIAKANALSETLPRDEDGFLTYDGDLQEACETALHRISDRYPLLSGWYPNVKTLRHSDLVSQMYIAGYYFPFSLEANVNGNMYIARYAECYCHELAHTHGYIYENEANFLAFVAGIESDDPMLQYSAILAVIGYLENDCYETFGEELYNREDYVFWGEKVANLDISFLPPGKMEEIEQNAVISTEVVDKVSDTITDTSLKVNGVSSGIVSYSEVVELLLEYYEGKLY